MIEHTRPFWVKGRWQLFGTGEYSFRPALGEESNMKPGLLVLHMTEVGLKHPSRAARFRMVKAPRHVSRSLEAALQTIGAADRFYMRATRPFATMARTDTRRSFVKTAKEALPMLLAVAQTRT
jgi:hypothetical protein